MNGYSQPYGQVDLPMPQPQYLNQPTPHDSSTIQYLIGNARAVSDQLSGMTTENPNSYVSSTTRLLYYGGITAAAYHGYKRNRSGLWALAWAAFAAMLPIVAPGVALAQGFGKPKRKNGRR